MEPVARLSAVNLRQVVSFNIVSNKITFINNAPKVFYKVVLRYKAHPPVPGQNLSINNIAEEEEVTLK